MKRKEFIRTLAMATLATKVFNMKAINEILKNGENTELMPLLFVGHGSPMNAIEDNVYSRGMKTVGKDLPKPKAILMVSAHWETKGTFVTAQEQPPTIHDFGGFPKELFEVEYKAPGSKWLADETIAVVKNSPVKPDLNWGFDHGCWSVTKNLFPNADIPMIQLSLDYNSNPKQHYELAKELQKLRTKGILIIGSGNMVHNFGYLQVKGNDFNAPFGHDWALEANEKFKKYIRENDHSSLIDYKKQGKAIDLSVPTPEHYLPLLYVLANKKTNESVEFFNDAAVGGSFTMTSVLIK